MAPRVPAIGRTRGEETPPRPLPPPPRPHNRRDLPRPSAFFKRGSHSHPRPPPAAIDGDDDDADEEPAPQPAPVPHAHPLAALSGARSGARNSPAVSSKRLHPAFLNPARVAAFADQENVPDAGALGLALVQQQQQQRGRQLEPASALATETKLSTRVIERQWRLQLDQPGVRLHHPPPLTDEELALAATDAAALRQALRFRDDARALAVAADEGDEAFPELARAMERKVGKQLDPAWVRTRSDPDNRPRRALERPEELDLYESLRRMTLGDAQRSSGRKSAGKHSLELETATTRRLRSAPLARRSFVGLPGSCFDPLHG